MLRVIEWVKRYLPAEILSVLATLLGGYLAFEISGSKLATALTATWAGNVAYFGYIIAGDILKTSRACQAENQTYSFRNFQRNVKALIIEFGVAEVADSFFIRPALLYYFPIWTGNLTSGLILAKLAADVTFYIPAIIGYEISKRKLRPVHS
jgi:hypothetical protein